MGWYEFDENAVMECRYCDWSGPATSGGIGVFKDCFGYECPRCGKSLAVFPLVSVEETERKAAEGNAKALAELKRSKGNQAPD